MDGVLVINKPTGMTSHDVVSRIKRRLGASKVGHLGTLDPMATGVLPLVVNRATKYAGVLQGGVKEYLATMKLGVETDTYDADGRVVGASDAASVTEGGLRDVLMGFVGRIHQIPPMFSAVKRQGVPLYRLARKGVVVEREPREIEVHSITFLDFSPPYATFSMGCSRGTYVRTLCHDAGKSLGCGAHLARLIRTRSGRFKLDGALSMEAADEALGKGIIPLKELLSDAEGAGDYWRGDLAS
ncbi:MAG: tRNA pseudouridine(55) synthase TruB [Deltaproteobacteria bacterium]|nr:tRNA pseudouridine(55) synthase TruB [Deltaproteobacteria bacterium]